MNRLFGIVLIAAAGFAGYYFEPQLRPAVLNAFGVGQVKKPLEPEKPKYPAPAIDLAAVTEDEFPPAVTLREEIRITDAEGQEKRIRSGSQVRPVRLEGNDLVVSPTGTNYEAKLHVMATDFVELVLKRRQEIADAEARKRQEPEPEPEVVTPKEEPKQDVVLTDTVQIMQASLKSSQITEFQYDQVVGWKDAGSENVGGQDYQVGLAAYQAETIFGPKQLQAKALIQDGKVVKWLFPKSGLEMK